MFNTETGEVNPVKMVVTGIVALLVIVGFFLTFEIVNAGQRGVVLRTGAVQDRILEEGFHFIIPFVESVKIMDVTIQKYEKTAQAASKDLQNVQTTIALNYHLNPLNVNDIYQQFRKDELDLVVNPTIEEAVKAATAKYTAEELISQRAALKQDITDVMKVRLEPQGFIIDGVSIVNFAFSDAFNVAIESKVTAEQEALAEKNKLEKVKYESEQKIVQAQAEAETIRIQAEAIQNQGGAAYVELKAVEKWNGILPVYMMPDSSVPFINIPNQN